MLFPTFTGTITAPIDVIGLDDDSTVTPQEATDMFFGGAIYAAVATSVRGNMVAQKQLGASGAAKYKAGKIAGLI
jgi:hypothetical protein